MFSIFTSNVRKIAHNLKPMKKPFDQKSLIYTFEKHMDQNCKKMSHTHKHVWVSLVMSGRLNKLVNFMFPTDIDVFICAFTKYIQKHKYTCKNYFDCNIYTLWKTVIDEFKCGCEFTKRYCIFRPAMTNEIYVSRHIPPHLSTMSVVVYDMIGSFAMDRIDLLIENKQLKQFNIKSKRIIFHNLYANSNANVDTELYDKLYNAHFM